MWSKLFIGVNNPLAKPVDYSLLDLVGFLNVAYSTLHLFLVEFVVLEDFPYVYPGGLKRWDALILPNLPTSCVISRKGELHISVELT